MKTVKMLMILLVVFVFSCKKDPSFVQADNSEFAKVINTGGIPEKVDKKEAVLDSSVSDSNMPDGSTWVCTTKKYSVTEGNSDFPLFNPNASVIYPGSLLQGKTLSAATPSVIPVKRAGGTISIDVIDGSMKPSFRVDEVTKSKIAEAANNIISGSTGIVPANFNFTAQQVQSTEQLSIALGLNVKTQFVEVETQFSFRQDKEYNRFIVKLNQSFYTLSFDIPTTVKDIFAPEVTPQQLSSYVGSGNPATFISDVTYGRVYYMLIESSSTSTEIQAKLNASFTTPTVGGGLDVDANSLKSLKDLQIKVVALGGEAQSTFATIGETNIATLVQMLGASTDIRAGVPISYVVRSVVDKEVVSVKLATEYEVKNCVPVSTPIGKPILWWDASSLLDAGNPLKTSSDQVPGNLAECMDNNGRYTFPAVNGSMYYYRDQVDLYNGIVVKKWPDLSGNKFDATSVAGDPDSRPMFIPGAFNNGRPALEFFRGKLAIYDNINNRLTYSGGVFVNTDYTILSVISYPDNVSVYWKELGNWVLRVNDKNMYGYFLSGNGTSTDPLTRLSVGFQNNVTFRLSHRQIQLYTQLPTFVPSPQYKVIAVTFSKTNGMAIYENGVLIAKDASVKRALISNEAAMICAPFPGEDYLYSRIRIGEIRAYGVGATADQVKQETAVLNQKYGL